MRILNRGTPVNQNCAKQNTAAANNKSNSSVKNHESASGSDPVSSNKKKTALDFFKSMFVNEQARAQTCIGERNR